MAANCSDPNWTARGDFVYDGDLDAPCYMYIPAIQGLYAMGAVLNGAGVLLSLAFLANLTLTTLRAPTAPPSGGRRQKQLVASSLWVLGWLALFASTLICAFCAVRAVSPTQGVGSSVAPTVLLSLGGVCFWLLLLVMIYRFVMLNIVNNKFRAADQYMERLGRLGKIQLGVMATGLTLGFLAVLVGLGASSAWGMYGVAFAHFEILAFTMVQAFLALRVVMLPVIRDINKSVESCPPGKTKDQMQLVAARMTFAYAELGRQALTNCLIAATWGAVPLLSKLSSYEFAIVWGSFAPSLVTLVLFLNTTVSRGESSQSSTRAGGGDGAVGLFTGTANSAADAHVASASTGMVMRSSARIPNTSAPDLALAAPAPKSMS